MLSPSLSVLLSAKAEAAILVHNRETLCSEWQSNTIVRSWVSHTMGLLLQRWKAQAHAVRTVRNELFKSH